MNKEKLTETEAKLKTQLERNENVEKEIEMFKRELTEHQSNSSNLTHQMSELNSRLAATLSHMDQLKSEFSNLKLQNESLGHLNNDLNHIHRCTFNFSLNKSTIDESISARINPAPCCVTRVSNSRSVQ